MTRSCIIMPLFNDWPSAAKLVQEIDRVVAEWDCKVTVLMIDDGSRQRLGDPSEWSRFCRHLDAVSIVELVCNQGHQRAIAVGLAYAENLACFDSVFVMDSDGEDPPDELDLLRRAGLRFPGAIITADRVSRSEGGIFRFCYLCYKLLFRLLTGTGIRFGNFCRIPAPLLSRLVHYPDLWNSLSGCIKKSGLPREAIDSNRGKRYFGPSKMSLIALVLHGLSAISVFKETMLLRLLFLSAPLLALSGALALAAAVSVPGGGPAFQVALFLSGGLFLTLTILDALVFLLLVHRLSNRAVRMPGPARFWGDYVKKVISIL
jgi:polyisoprenyl-phosphate glycosyltransferase